MKRRPILVSLALLILGIGAVAWTASLALIFLMPQPIETGPSLAEIVRVLNKDLDPQVAAVQIGRRLQSPVPLQRNDVARVVALRVSQGLTRKSEVRASVGGFSIRGLDGRAPSFQAAVADGSLMLSRSTLAVRDEDGGWTVLRTAQPLLSAWHVKIACAFLAFSVLMIPLAFLAARRLSNPIRSIAVWANGAGIDESDADPPLGGPRELQEVAWALRRMRDRLKRQIEERTAMLTAVAHDLRTPLTSLRLRSERAPPDLRAKMADDIARLEQMIEQFLDFGGGLQGPAERERVDLADVADSAARDAVLAGLTVAHVRHAPLILSGHAPGLRRMIANLIDNAARHGGYAVLTLEEEEECALLRVTDRGPGLPEDELDRVFQPFYRTDRARGRHSGGAGLGLAIVRAVARAHEGQISLHNRQGGGLEAIVRLPKLCGKNVREGS